MRMRVGSLFAGIGGFDLGLERAGFEIAWQVEINPDGQRILTKHWPHVPRFGDICAIDWSIVPRIDVLCGGFPCQDLSYAGKRAGIDGERSGLWSEYVRAIRALRPKYVIVENVPGLLTNAYLGRVLRDLAQSGYDAEWACVPASAFGALHRRDRVWIVAYPQKQHEPHPYAGTNGHMEEADAGGQILEFGRRALPAGFPGWDEPSPYLSLASMDRVVDGVSPTLDDVKKHIKGQLHGLGNAIVPQLAEWIGRQIMKAQA